MEFLVFIISSFIIIFYMVIDLACHLDCIKGKLINNVLWGKNLIHSHKKAVCSVYQVHDSEIYALTFCTIKTKCIVTTSKNCIKIWTEDFSEMLLEVRIDSECTNLVTYNNQYLIMGCINSSICYLNTSEREIRYLVRTHNAKVIECVYQPYLKALKYPSKTGADLWVPLTTRSPRWARCITRNHLFVGLKMDRWSYLTSTGCFLYFVDLFIFEVWRMLSQ